MKQKDIERLAAAAWELVRNPAKRHVWRLKIAKILEEIDPHGLYRPVPIAHSAAFAQTGEELEPKLRGCPQIEPWPPRTIRDSTNGDS
jgi:hypothetical protein